MFYHQNGKTVASIEIVMYVEFLIPSIQTIVVHGKRETNKLMSPTKENYFSLYK